MKYDNVRPLPSSQPGRELDVALGNQCYNNGQQGTEALSEHRYSVMRDALASSGGKILYSVCNWGADYVSPQPVTRID